MSSTAQTPPPTIRHATADDIPLILSLIQELAAYEKASSSVLATEASLLQTLFPPTGVTPYAKTILIFSPQAHPSLPAHTIAPACAGMALFFTNYSTWRAAPGIYLEDLFVRPEYRGRGYGTALLRELAGEVGRIGGQRLEWSVLKWNEPSLKFYESLGAVRMDEWVGMRVEGDGVGRMARGEGKG